MLLRGTVLAVVWWLGLVRGFVGWSVESWATAVAMNVCLRRHSGRIF